jgi:hypothetical protein
MGERAATQGAVGSSVTEAAFWLATYSRSPSRPGCRGVRRGLRFRGPDAMLASGLRHDSRCAGSGYEVAHGRLKAVIG